MTSLSVPAMNICHPLFRICIPALAIHLLLAGCENLRTAMGDYETVVLCPPCFQEAYSEWTPPMPAHARGRPRADMSVVGSELLVNGMAFERGVSFGGNGILTCSPDGRAARLEMLAGIDDASPADEGGATLEIFGRGRSLFQCEITQRSDPVRCSVSIAGVDQLLIRVDAPTNVYTDLLMPRLSGVPGLGRALEEGKTSYEKAVYATPRRLNKARKLANASVLFPCARKGFGQCIGLSNDALCLVVSPGHGGRIVHFGPDLSNNLIAGGAEVSPHPAERRVAHIPLAYEGTWKWKLDSDGTFRLLSPPDIASGLRWSRTFFLIPGKPVLHSVILAKNVVGRDISWSAGTVFHLPAHATLFFQAENTLPGYSLKGSPSDSIEVKNNIVTINPADTDLPDTRERGGQVVATDAGSWFAARLGNAVLYVKAMEPRIGLFPYNGARLMARCTAGGKQVTLFGELTPLSPGQHMAQEQFWVAGSWQEDARATLSSLEQSANRALDYLEQMRRPPGKPTGRTLRPYP